MSAKVVEVSEGTSPLVLSIPHAGVELPEEIRARLNETGLALTDTDWHIDDLYAFAARFDPTIICARLSRYVIDLNRDPSGAPLYPGMTMTDLVPLATFDRKPIWREPPDEDEIERRVGLYFEPWHAALKAAVASAKARHGYAVLFDCHSIRSVIPSMFQGVLPVLNPGTNGGLSAGAAVRKAAFRAVRKSGFSHALDNRFKGGWITRTYGRPNEGVHAFQMEIAQRAYLVDEAPPWTFDPDKARPLQAALGAIIEAILEAAGSA